MWQKKYSYYNTKKSTVNGKTYDSKFEAGYAEELEKRKNSGEIVGFETHQRLPLEVNGYVVADYYIDFVVNYPDGLIEYVETKGYPTDVWKLKWRLFCALYKDKENCKITLIMQGKQKAPKLRKRKI